MLQKVSVRFSNQSTTVEVDTPDKCPHCENTMTPKLHLGVSEFSYDNRGQDKTFGILVQCSNSRCKKYYAISYSKLTSGENIYNKYSYITPIEVSLPENIEMVSPDFVDIYKQAAQAESQNLLQIAGVGYRKAAEFLIKDYAIRNNEDKTDNIKRMQLGNVIATYLTDFPKVQTLAKAIAWIGNDETHYVRRHSDKDIKDLKKFILAASQFIAADYDVDDALEFTTSDN